MAESTLEPPSGFGHGTPGLGIQRLNHWAIAPSVQVLLKTYEMLVNSFTVLQAFKK